MIKKTKKLPVESKVTKSFKVTEQMIRDRAQAIFEKTGRHDSLANWLQAEKELGLGSK